MPLTGESLLQRSGSSSAGTDPAKRCLVPSPLVAGRRRHGRTLPTGTPGPDYAHGPRRPTEADDADGLLFVVGRTIVEGDLIQYFLDEGAGLGQSRPRRGRRSGHLVAGWDAIRTLAIVGIGRVIVGSRIAKGGAVRSLPCWDFSFRCHARNGIGQMLLVSSPWSRCLHDMMYGGLFERIKSWKAKANCTSILKVPIQSLQDTGLTLPNVESTN